MTVGLSAKIDWSAPQPELMQPTMISFLAATSVYFIANILTYFAIIMTIYFPRFFSQGYPRPSNPRIAWKLGLHILFHLISMLPLLTETRRFYNFMPQQASNGKLPFDPCYTTGSFADFVNNFRVFTTCVLLYVARSLADPLLHIVWEPTLRTSCFNRCGGRKLGEDSTRDETQSRRKTTGISSDI